MTLTLIILNWQTILLSTLGFCYISILRKCKIHLILLECALAPRILFLYLLLLLGREVVFNAKHGAHLLNRLVLDCVCQGTAPRVHEPLDVEEVCRLRQK